MAQLIGVIGIFVSGHDLVQPLAQQGQSRMLRAAFIAPFPQGGRSLLTESMVLVEGPQGQQSGIATDASSGKIGLQGKWTIEGEAQLWYNTVYQVMDAPKKGCWGCYPSVHQSFRASFIFLPEKS
jgi:hypothetical protein